MTTSGKGSAPRGDFSSLTAPHTVLTTHDPLHHTDAPRTNCCTTSSCGITRYGVGDEFDSGFTVSLTVHWKTTASKKDKKISKYVSDIIEEVVRAAAAYDGLKRCECFPCLSDGLKTSCRFKAVIPQDRYCTYVHGDDRDDNDPHNAAVLRSLQNDHVPFEGDTAVELARGEAPHFIVIKFSGSVAGSRGAKSGGGGRSGSRGASTEFDSASAGGGGSARNRSGSGGVSSKARRAHSDDNNSGSARSQRSGSGSDTQGGNGKAKKGKRPSKGGGGGKKGSTGNMPKKKNSSGGGGGDSGKRSGKHSDKGKSKQQFDDPASSNASASSQGR